MVYAVGSAFHATQPSPGPSATRITTLMVLQNEQGVT